VFAKWTTLARCTSSVSAQIKGVATPAFQLAAGFSSLNESAVVVVRHLEVVDSSSRLCGK
jgi:hypothetical protein